MRIEPIFIVAAITAIALASATARAADPVVVAEAAYDAATQAHEEGDYRRAAELFARADELAPNPVALETALREALLADLPVLAMDLVARAARESPPGPALRAAMDEASQKYASRVGKIEVRCEACSANLDGLPIAVNVAVSREVGERRLEVVTGDHREPSVVVIEAGRTTTLTVRATPPTAPKRAAVVEHRKGAHPAWITLGIVATVGLGAGAVVSYIDTVGIADDLAALRDANQTSGAAELADKGRAAEIRTYVLEGVTAASGVATVFFGIFGIDWSGSSRRNAPTVTMGPAWFQVNGRY